MTRTRPPWSGTCFGCGTIIRRTVHMRDHLSSCDAPLNLDLVYELLDIREQDGHDIITSMQGRHIPKISYGRIGMSWPVHRVIAFHKYGPQPKGLYLLHRCDIRSCVSCLEYGTPSMNNYDAWRNGRRQVTEEWKVAIMTAHRASDKVKEHARKNSLRNAEVFRGDNHWTRQSDDAMTRWKQAIANGKVKTV